MSNEQSKFILYEYLVFFWKKKLVFLAIPLILVLGALAYTFMQNPDYEARAYFFTGGLTEDTLTDNDIVKPDYKKLIAENLQGTFSAIVPNESRVLFTLTSPNKTELEKEIEKVSDEYLTDLEKAYQTRIDLTLEKIENLSTQVKKSEESIAIYKEKLESSQSENMKELFQELILVTESTLSTSVSDLNNAKQQLYFFESDKPRLVELVIAKEDNHLIPNILVGIFGGIFLAMLTLIAWKYILDARREYND